MDVWTFGGIINEYKKCPECGSNNDLQCSLKNEIVTISCKCGFLKNISSQSTDGKYYNSKEE